MVESPLTLKECAAIARVHYDTVRKAVKRGDLPAYTMPGGRVVRVRPSDLEAWIYSERAAEPRPARPEPWARPRPDSLHPPGSLEELDEIERSRGR